MAGIDPGCVKTRNSRKPGGSKTPPHMSIVALRASGEAGFSQGVLQREFSHNLDPNASFEQNN